MTSARSRVAHYWDDHVARWLAGDDPLPDPLSDWFASYQGRAGGAVTRDGFPEPFMGDLLGTVTTPRLVILGLNPGRYHPEFQARDGIFAEELCRYGSFSAWAATAPYCRPPWTTIVGPNRYYRTRLAFTARWLDDPPVGHNHLMIFEAYPWHSTLVNAPLRPPPELVDRFVWQPIAELPTRDVFAFGRPWNDLAVSLGLPVTDALGSGGRPYGSRVTGRGVRVYALPSGQRLIVEWHPGSAGPPSALETAILRAALD